jgi:hypothetical protein
VASVDDEQRPRTGGGNGGSTRGTEQATTAPRARRRTDSMNGSAEWTPQMAAAGQTAERAGELAKSWKEERGGEKPRLYTRDPFSPGWWQQPGVKVWPLVPVSVTNRD